MNIPSSRDGGGVVDDLVQGLQRKVKADIVAISYLISRPDWAIQACREQAESIMESGRAQYSDAAANWLAKARKAYQIMSREQEWHVYLKELLTRHGRKYKLIPILKAFQ